MRLVLVLFLSMAACRAAPLHREGDSMWTFSGEFGIPLKGKSLAWDGGYDAESWRLTAQQHYFVSDRVALGAGVTVTRWQLPGTYRWGGEVNASCRWFFAELNELEDLGFFFDINGGAIIANGPFPPLGTERNFTFSFGPGFEIPINDTFSFLGAVQYHHLSNALGRESPQNPSQNEVRFWIGAGIVW